MKVLSPDQMNRIREDVARANITLLSLQEELIDHICCEVENRMEEGLSFEEAYRMLQHQANSKTLQDILESTLLLTNKHFALMKTTMKLSGLFALSLISIGTLLRILIVPGANMLIVSGFVLLTFLFLPSAVFLEYTFSAQKKLFQRISLLLGSMALCNGILFKVMQWTGANVLINLGFLLLLVLVLPLVFSTQVKSNPSKTEKYLFGFGIISLGLFALGVLFKLMHWPGTAVLLIAGIILFMGLFIPAYSLLVLQKKERSIAPFIFMIILSIYMVTMTGLISVSSTTDHQTSAFIQQPK
ncbi:MAG: hypothetical protein WC760_10345 [Bacteroidia bacterium]|jgi:hypothetical protein